MNPSDVIDQRYRLERLVGTGGMAEVWLAEDQRLRRWVAIKLLREDGAEAGEVAGREARLVAQLQHPNVVSVYDVGVHEGRAYIVMEYVHGYSVAQLLQTQGRFLEAEAIRYGVQVAAALDHASQQGLIHRDIKPANILIDEKGVAKLADFGVASVVNQTLAPGQADEILGSIAYLPPEVIQGAPPDRRGDVYSLGMTLYEMVSGRLPFAGTSSAAIAGQRLASAAPPIRTLARGASPEFEAVIARALSLNPADRFQTGGQFASALRSVPPPKSGTALPIIAPQGRAPRPLGAQPGRRPRSTTVSEGRGFGGPSPGAGGKGAGPMIAMVAGVVLLALAAGGAAALVLSQREGENAGLATPTPTRTAQVTVAPTKPATAKPTNEPTLTPTPPPSPSASPRAPATPTVANPTAVATATRPATAGPTLPPPTVAPTRAPAPSATP